MLSTDVPWVPEIARPLGCIVDDSGPKVLRPAILSRAYGLTKAGNGEPTTHRNPLRLLVGFGRLTQTFEIDFGKE